MPTKRKEGIPSTPKRKQAFDQKFIRRASSLFAGICLSVLFITAMQTSIY
jgi:hypothetical protein